MSTKFSTKSNSNITFIAKIGILGALSCIIMLFEFPIPIAPPFYELDFSEVVVLIGGFALGPGAAVCIEGLKILLNILLNGTVTMGVGEVANFIIGCSFVLPATILYWKRKTRKTALLGLFIGILVMTIVASLVNYFILIPAYVFFLSPAMTLDKIINMGQVIFPSIDSLSMLVLLCVIPFNLIKGILVSTIVSFSYKKIAPLLKNK